MLQWTSGDYVKWLSTGRIIFKQGKAPYHENGKKIKLKAIPEFQTPKQNGISNKLHPITGRSLG